MARTRRNKSAQSDFFPGFTDVAEIGTGSLAVVYRARELGTNRLVALKLLNVRDASPRAIESFERESVALGAVSAHPNIVTLYRSFRSEDGRPVLVLELCSRSMGEVVHTGQALPARDVVALGIKIAAALETAHRAQILHRDVKPQNILITEYGEPALADFGVAMLQSSTQTTAGLFDFTTLHAAPELLEGRATAAATDVYELASTLYQLLAGRSAFRAYDGESPASVILRILRDPVQPVVDVNVPPELSDLLVRAMSKEISGRPASAAEFAAALLAVEAGQGWQPTQFVIRDAAGRPAELPRVTLPPPVAQNPVAPLPVVPPPVAPLPVVPPPVVPPPVVPPPVVPPPVVPKPPPSGSPVPEVQPRAGQVDGWAPAPPEPRPAAPVVPALPAAATDWSTPVVSRHAAPSQDEDVPPLPRAEAERAVEPAVPEPYPVAPEPERAARHAAPDRSEPRPASRIPRNGAHPDPPDDQDGGYVAPPPVATPPPPVATPPPPVAAPPPPVVLWRETVVPDDEAGDDPPPVAAPAGGPAVEPRAAPPEPRYPIPPAAAGADAGSAGVPMWSVRAQLPAGGDLRLNPDGLRERVTLRAAGASLSIDASGLVSRQWLKRSEIPWHDVLGIETRRAGDGPAADGVIVVVTHRGPVELAATRGTAADLRYTLALLDAYRQRSRRR